MMCSAACTAAANQRHCSRCRKASQQRYVAVMLVVDTNVIVRYLTNDDTAQATRARRLLAQQSIFVPLTVLLETEWVLRSVYGFGASAVVHALRAFAGLPRVTLETPET